MGRYRVQGYASLKIGDKEYKSGDEVEVSDEVAARFKLAPVATEEPRPVRDPIRGSKAPPAARGTAVAAQTVSGATKGARKAGATHTAPPVDRTKETPGQTRQGPAATDEEASADGEATASRKRR